jgi:hypothetical protein
MIRNGLAAAALAAACAMPAHAHQLDEYLQAARIGVEPDRIIVELSLTPGTSVAREIFSSLDRDDDGHISASETDAYGRSILRDLALEMDGRSCPLRILRAQSPSWSEIREGLGTIRVEAEAGVGLPHGHHRLRFVNNHRSDIGVYLVNALMPSTGDIIIRAQQRDVRQHGIVLEVDRSSPYLGALWIVVPLAAAIALMSYRRQFHVMTRRGACRCSTAASRCG